jgi:hypothetical protein
LGLRSPGDRGTGDITTLANPEVVDKIREQGQSAKRTRGEAPRELSETEQREIKNLSSQ